MRKRFENPEVEVVCFQLEDVITASAGGDGGIVLPPSDFDDEE